MELGLYDGIRGPSLTRAAGKPSRVPSLSHTSRTIWFAVSIGYRTTTKGFTTVIERDWLLHECISMSSITNHSSITVVNP